jgi:hypothetical protein
MPLKIFSQISKAVNKFTHDGDVEVTIYPTYGYWQNNQWNISLRGRVHQKRQLPDELLAELVSKAIGYDEPDKSILIARSRDFTDDSRSGQQVTIAFDADQERFDFPQSDFNGLIERNIELSDERARQLLAAQGASRWLTFTVVSEGHTGKGYLRLIEPEGLSIVSDIDDTIKVTLVPGDKDEVLRRTLCRDFEAVSAMPQMYHENWGDASFHYVTGAPWQLYRSLEAFLIRGTGGFPEGTFHMTYYPKNFLSEDTREILIEAIIGSLGTTFAHKVSEIRKLMTRFPQRKFILIGDSGEVDPEVYRHIKGEFADQVEEIWIRDVLDEERVNHFRLGGMKTIKVEPVICSTDNHHKKLSMRFEELYPDETYARNTAPPCGG